MSKATPGPWEVWKGNFEVFAGPAEENTSASIVGYRVPIAKCGYAYDDGYILSRAECQANAQLIAAAPALLAACKAALELPDIESAIQSDDADCVRTALRERDEVLSQLRAAIAGAESPD